MSTISSIYGNQYVPPAGRVGADPTGGRRVAGVEQDRADRVELSEGARALNRAEQPFRTDLVSRIKSQIEAGTYDLDGKLDSVATSLVAALNTQA